MTHEAARGQGCQPEDKQLLPLHKATHPVSQLMNGNILTFY